MFLLGAIVSLCYVPGITGAFIATQWPVLAVLLPFGLMRRGPFTAFHLLGLLFVAYATATLLWSPNLYGSVYGLWLVTIAALSVWLGTTLGSVRELYAGLAVGAIVSSLIAVLQYFGVETVPTSSTAPNFAGLYVNGVQQAAVLAIVAVALITERMWLPALFLAPGIWLAHSRGGYIVLLVGLLGCITRRLWIPAGILVMLAPIYLLFPFSSSDAQRMYVWRAAWDGLTWFGWGTGVFYGVLMSKGDSFFLPEYVHNDYLQLALEYGVGATLPFAVLGYAMWRTDVKEWPIVLAFCTAACFSMPLSMPIAAFLALVAVGRILRVHGVYGGYRGVSGHAILPRIRFGLAARCAAFSVASHHTAKG